MGLADCDGRIRKRPGHLEPRIIDIDARFSGYRPRQQ